MKVRAKIKDNGEIVYGYYVFTHNRCYVINNEYISIEDEDPLEYFIEVYEDSICICTGLEDKMGTTLFQGDKFKYTKHDSFLIESFEGTVVWIEENASFGYTDEDPFFITSFSEHDELKEDFLNHIEII